MERHAISKDTKKFVDALGRQLHIGDLVVNMNTMYFGTICEPTYNVGILLDWGESRYKLFRNHTVMYSDSIVKVNSNSHNVISIKETLLASLDFVKKHPFVDNCFKRGHIYSVKGSLPYIYLGYYSCDLYNNRSFGNLFCEISKDVDAHTVTIDDLPSLISCTSLILLSDREHMDILDVCYFGESNTTGDSCVIHNIKVSGGFISGANKEYRYVRGKINGGYI